MWTLGKFVVLTRNELIETVNDEKALAYRRGLHSKWRTKKLLEPPPPAGILDVEKVTSPSIYGDSLPLPNSNAVTYSGSTEGELPTESIPQFNMKKSEMEDAA